MTSSKKFFALIKFVFTLNFVFSLFGLSNAGAVSDSDTLHLRGIIEQVVSIEVRASNQAENLDLSQAQSNLKVADVIEKSNNQAGYVVTLVSANGGNLVRSGGNESVSYKAKYESTDVILSGQAQVITDQGPQVRPIRSQKSFSVSYDGVDPTQMLSGSYEDTLTFEIIAR